jgi:nucleoside phosphorylase
MKNALIITSLMCEATPLIDAWGLKLTREGEIQDRFQLFHSNNIYLGISGIGKLRSAVATSALISHLLPRHGALVAVNIGIAGAPASLAPKGTLALVHKVRDVATNSRMYPDVLLKHPAQEFALDTYDHPVTTPPTNPALVDMECSGFMQAATTLLPPSAVAVLKIVSDYCDGARITPQEASSLVASHVDTMEQILYALRSELPDAPQIDPDEQSLINNVVAHARLSATQTIELMRRLRAKKAQAEPFTNVLRELLRYPIETKDDRRVSYHALLKTLDGDTLP